MSISHAPVMTPALRAALACIDRDIPAVIHAANKRGARKKLRNEGAWSPRGERIAERYQRRFGKRKPRHK